MIPSSWVIETDGLPATTPAKRTTPPLAARTVVPGVAAKSTPRCPDCQRGVGLSKPRTTVGRGCRGAEYEGDPRGGTPPTMPGAAMSRTSTRLNSVSAIVSTLCEVLTSIRRTDHSGGSARTEDFWNWTICLRTLIGHLVSGGVTSRACIRLPHRNRPTSRGRSRLWSGSARTQAPGSVPPGADVNCTQRNVSWLL